MLGDVAEPRCHCPEKFPAIRYVLEHWRSAGYRWTRPSRRHAARQVPVTEGWVFEVSHRDRHAALKAWGKRWGGPWKVRRLRCVLIDRYGRELRGRTVREVTR